MKTTSCRKKLSSLLVLAGLCSLAPAAQADWIFSGVNGGAANTSVAGTTETGAAVSLNIAGVYAANNAGNTNFASTSTTWSSGSLLYYSGGGLGMGSDGTTSPNHAIDNNGNTEGVLLNFGSAVALSQIGLGYISDNNSATSPDTADLSVFRYTGNAATPPTVGSGATLSAMAAAGWQLVSNYANISTDATTPYTSVNTSGLTSSWWLITAYNANYGAGTGLEMGNDYFKLYAVAAKTPTNNTPEPGSLALASLAVIGLAYTRRKRKA